MHVCFFDDQILRIYVTKKTPNLTKKYFWTEVTTFFEEPIINKTDQHL